MNLAIIPFFILVFLKPCCCHDVPLLFEGINQRLIEFNAIAADIAWQSTLDPRNPKLPERAEKYEKSRLTWQHRMCDFLKSLEKERMLNRTQRRQSYLLCRGPKYLPSEARQISKLYDELQDIYSGSKVCLPTIDNSPLITAESAILNFLTAAKTNCQKNCTSMAAKLAVSENFENGMCFVGEEDFEILMRSKNFEILEWSWLVWREKVGPPMRKPYAELVDIENTASRRNGYTDIGHAWREELETPNLRILARNLYSEIRPLYVALHGILRFFLRRIYGEVVPEYGPIPAHLTGDLWSQNWGSLIEVILPQATDYDLDKSVQHTNWTVIDMVKKAEDFYTSMSLPPMTDKFWENSVLEREEGQTRCHGTAANMYREDDFRMLYCADVTMDDFYVIHHEMGHIHYYMAYQDQPGVFREGTNSAFHETIGDAIMYGVMSPQHLYRLGLINDTLLFDNDNTKTIKISKETAEEFFKFVKVKEYNDRIKKIKVIHANDKERFKFKLPKRLKELKLEITKTKDDINEETNHDNNQKIYHDNNQKINRQYEATEKVIDVTFDEIHLLKQALVKIPQIPFALLIDEYRWALDEGDFDERSYNEEFWKLVLDLQGVAPLWKRGENYFDVGAKYHVPDNTPYIRYFLSSFLQAQVFRSLCRASVLGVGNKASPLPRGLPLHRCDIYGSKHPGRLLKRMMSQGASIHWREALHMLTNEDEISSEALLQYYQPLYPLLTKLIQHYNIPLGW